MSFELHPNLKKKALVCDLPVCRVLFEDVKYYPWIILVPRISSVSRIMDLTHELQLKLMLEIDAAQKILWKEFSPTQLNVASIGNKTPQLHIHVIARFDTDPAWPGTVWDHPTKDVYHPEEKQHRLEILKRGFEEVFSE